MMKPSVSASFYGPYVIMQKFQIIFHGNSIPKEKADAVVFGAGVVAITVARELAMRHGREVVVIESAPTFGTCISSRNSEVVYSGIYYPRNSLKALFCVRGRQLLYKHCKEHEIPHLRIGKLIVATGLSGIPKWNLLMTRGVENEVQGLRMMEGHKAATMEPELHCVKALSSPISGGSRNPLRNLHIPESKSLKSWDKKYSLKPDLILIPRLVVNCAGLSTLALCKRMQGINEGTITRPYFARGCYFTLVNVKTPPFQHLI